MELQGESLIAAPRDRVWTALNDPQVLARCIDGVETLTQGGDGDGATRFEGRMTARVGPARAAFAGGVTLTEADAPNRCVLVGEGRGDAGFANGSAEVVLTDTDVDGVAGTRLGYAITSSVGDELAQPGARLNEGTAKGYAETFFSRLKAEVETRDEVPAAVAPIPPGGCDAETLDALHGQPPLAPTPKVQLSCDDARNLHGVASRGVPPLTWAGILIALVIVLLVWQLW